VLDEDLAGEARHASRVTGVVSTGTCPLACLERAAPWVREVTAAVSIAASDWGVTVAEALGRELTHADLIALAALTRGQRESLASDREIDRRDRDAAEKARSAGARH
jgi:hypothetical protein